MVMKTVMDGDWDPAQALGLSRQLQGLASLRLCLRRLCAAVSSGAWGTWRELSTPQYPVPLFAAAGKAGREGRFTTAWWGPVECPAHHLLINP